MSQYAESRDLLDDGQVSDGDGVFAGVNQRLPLNQLGIGEVRESLNGRMDGHWKPRKGVVARTGDLGTGGKPLRLPFFLIDVDKAISGAVVSGGVVTLTVTGHGLSGSGWGRVSGLAGNGPVNGDYFLTVTGANTLTFLAVGFNSITDQIGTLGTIPINNRANLEVRGSCLFSDPNLANSESVVLGFDSKAILVDLKDYGTRDILYPTGKALNGRTDMIQAFDRVYLFREGAQAFEWFPSGRQIESASQIGNTITIRVKDHGLTVGDQINVAGLTGGSPPSNGDFVVDTVTDKDVFTYKAFLTMVIGGTLNPDVTGNVPFLLFDPSGAPRFRREADGCEIYWDAVDYRWVILRPTLPGFVTWHSDGTSLAATPLPSLATGWVPGAALIAPPATGTPTVSNLGQTVTFGVVDAVLKGGFTLVPAGDYTQPQIFKAVGNNGSVASGVVSLTVSGNTTIQEKDTIIIYETDVPEFESIKGKSFEVLSATTTNITFIAPISNLATLGGGLFVEFGGRFSVGGGFIHQPAPPWGTYFQRRLWVPFYYSPGGTYAAPTYENRKITDEIAASDILDSHTFDQIANQFRITGGTSDYLVAMQGFYDDKLVVLNRNSLHLISGTSGSLNDTKVTALTNEVGCLARKSVVMKKNAMFFLSDDGVYGVEFLNDYNLRGANEPISKNIQPYIDRINKNLSSQAVGVLFNNRYYLAVALDSLAGANDATGNNSILIFNFINNSWESLDNFSSPDFIIENLIIGGASERNSIYAVTKLGGLHELEAVESSNDNLTSSGSAFNYSINSSLTTRGYSLGNLDRKRFTDGQLTLQCVDQGLGEYCISFAAEDPDNNEPIGTTTDFLGGQVLGTGAISEDETGNVRFRIGGIRGYVGSLTLTRTIGSPKITSIKVTGTVTNRQIISQT